MSSDLQQIRIGLTNNHPCSYLKDRMERVAVAIDTQMQSPRTTKFCWRTGFVVAETPSISPIAIRAAHVKRSAFPWLTLRHQKVKNAC